MERAIGRLRAEHGGVGWRDAVVESSAILTRGVAGLLESLAVPHTEEQVRARRFARVKVAEMQLYQPAQIKAGQASRDLYRSLKPLIDEARGAFQTQFLTSTNIVPDYLHEELVRVLAQNDSALLGPQYPGPLA